MMKIFCVGNSFSQDATRYLEEMAAGALFVRNGYIGGCSLERHAQNAATNEALYEYQKDGERVETISLKAALEREPWDYVTVQQCSHLSGIPDTYEPYLTQLLAYIREHAPTARVVFHQTWAYEETSDHEGFVRYNRDQMTMFRAICRTSEGAAATHGLPLLRTGEAIQALRGLPGFDPGRGGRPLTRDGFHLSLDYGRYAAGLWWYHFFTGRPVTSVTAMPMGADPALIARIRDTLAGLPQAAQTV